MSYLVIGFIPERSDRLSGLPITPLAESSGVHTPLRQDGYYSTAEGALGVALCWRDAKLHSRERVVVVRVIDEPESENRPRISEIG